MALQLNYTDSTTGMVSENAYYKARKDGILRGNEVIFSVDVFVSKEARQTKGPLASIEYYFISNSDISYDEIIRAGQFYGLLKILPEYAGAIDC